MTENKRFNLWDMGGTAFIEDHKEGSYHIGKTEDVDINSLRDITKRLNIYADENEQLKQSNKRYALMVNCNSYLNDEIYEQLKKTEKNYKSLLDENEQLKQEIGNLEHTKDFCADVCADCERLEKENEQLKEEIARQKYTKHIMRENIKSYERAIKRLRKSYEEFDEMRLERIRFLEKRLKKNGLSIYVYGCGDVE